MQIHANMNLKCVIVIIMFSFLGHQKNYETCVSALLGKVSWVKGVMKPNTVHGAQLCYPGSL